MKLFECQACGQPLYFENTSCESCGHWLGYLPSAQDLSALEADRDTLVPLAVPGARVRYCANADYDACNWLVPADEPGRYCVACRHNRVVPDLSEDQNVSRWRQMETAKRRLFYTLLKLGLPLTAR